MLDTIQVRFLLIRKQINVLKKVSFLLSVFSFLALTSLQAQNSSKFPENQIEELCFGVLNAEKESERLQYNTALKTTLKECLLYDGAFQHPFSKVKSLGILSSPDSLLRIFNWMIPLENGHYAYECFILFNEEGESNLIELNALHPDSTLSLYSTYTKDNWPAALYYKLIQTEDKFNTYYTLLGWDGHNRLSTKKYIDVFSFDQSGNLKIGYPLFEVDGKLLYRRKFEYSSQHAMKLNYDEKSEEIRFDFLAPLKPSYEGMYEFYFPAMTQDAYRWEEDQWKFIELIDTDKGHMRDRKRIERAKEDIIQKDGPLYNSKKTVEPQFYQIEKQDTLK